VLAGPRTDASNLFVSIAPMHAANRQPTEFVLGTPAIFGFGTAIVTETTGA
jgi:hypothetical protein